MLRTLLAAVVLLTACSTAAPGVTGQPTQPAATPPPSTATPTSAAVATPTAATPTSGITAAPCDPYYGECEPKYTPRPTPGSSGVTISVANGHLVDQNGMSLYVFDNDSPGVSACTGDCSGTWPPLALAAGERPHSDAQLSKPLVSFQRADGTFQAGYGFSPLYNYSGDTAPGDVNGDGINGVWHLATP